MGQWKPGESSEMFASALSGIRYNSDFSKITWDSKTNKPSYAYSVLIKIANKLNPNKIMYINSNK